MSDFLDDNPFDSAPVQRAPQGFDEFDMGQASPPMQFGSVPQAGGFGGGFGGPAAPVVMQEETALRYGHRHICGRVSL
jgi:hypothetical protein